MSRRYYYLGGLVLFVVALAELFAPGVLGLPFGNITAGLVAVAALLYGLVVVQSRRDQAVTRTETPDVELTRPTTVPGERLRDVLNTFPGVTTSRRSDARIGLRGAVVATLTQYGEYTESEAEAAVREGTWTDDPVAAEFVAGVDSGRPVRDRIRSLLGRESYDQHERTVDALLGVAGIRAEETTTAEFPGDFEETTVDPSPREATGALTLGRRRLTRHWLGVGIVALVCLGVGVLTRSPAVLLGSVVGIGYVAYARAHSLDDPGLTIERTVEDADPEPGEEVEVTVRITNDGPELLADVRLIDGVPESLAVSEGSPRRGTVLRPGESETLSYTVTATRGHHEFGPALVLVRNLPGSVEREVYLRDETTIECSPSTRPIQRSVPVRNSVTGLPGQIETETGGSGITFQTIREYQPGDPLSRIDWNYRARTGELATVDFQQQRAASVVVLIDVRETAYVGPSPDAPNAVERSVAGAAQVFERLLDDGNLVGIAAMGEADCWLAPGTGNAHRERARKLFGSSPALSPSPPESGRTSDWLRQLRQQLDPGTQLLVFSPLCDPGTVRIIRDLDARGFPVTVISPDPTGSRTAAQKLFTLRRRLTLTALRRASIPVMDWQPETPLEALFRGRQS
ncbi:DUF58 domain-containing protein [Halovenus sp. WSH3]|uniref:DUF58 domain-containing protein n=1 Tax=Halovenus carboxidivorans TaxID=2692199 RepID=A0A6B0T6A9_9EURY|nr:DUF58 domain-containing protein [Halovenus carboxidivorans]MXR51113.1 DUF58 domain-containing protein [Halovenus carboxidivorans]